MACIDYEIKLFDQTGLFIKFLTDFETFELSRTKNDIGTFTIVLPGLTHSILDFRCDYRAEVYRKGALVGNTCWFLQRKELTLENSKELITLTFADTIDIISRRINTWYSCEVPPCFGALEDVADDAIKTLMRANFTDMISPATDPVLTPPASPGTGGVINHQGVPTAVTVAYTDIYGTFPTSRVMPITVEEYRSDGVLIRQEVSFIDVLTAVQDIANASAAIPQDNLQHNLWFDIEYAPATTVEDASFIFKTWVGVKGQDLRNVKFVGPEYGNLVNSVFIDDCSTKGDIAYVLGDGDGAAQLVGSAWLDETSNSYYYSLPFGPIEIVTEFSQETGSDDLLQGEGLSVLGALNKTKTLDGEIINTDDFDFMTDYNFGDILTLNWGDVNETIEINEFAISVDSDGIEAITVPLTLL